MVSSRIGIFLLIVGGLLVFMFVLTDIAEAPQFGYFVLGLASAVAGVLLLWRAPTAPPSKAERFRFVRRLGSRNQNRKK